MTDTKISGLTEDTAPTGGNYFPEVDDTAGTPTTKYIKGYRFSEMGPLNYKISPTVSSNNLTVALKTLAGNDPSVTNPIIFKIGDAWRVVTTSLSVTLAAATNWMNAGGVELATKEIDYFVYIGYNTTDGVTLGVSRIPYARQYNEFSATSTNEKYARISTITNVVSTDPYENIGRFAATLSAGAGYTWTVPTYGALNLVQRPILETRLLDFVSTITYSGGTTDPTSNTPSSQKYRVSGRVFFCTIVSVLVIGTGNRTSTIFTIPFSAAPLVTAVSAIDNITVGGAKNAVASYINGNNTFVIVEIMAQNGTYYGNGNFLFT